MLEIKKNTITKCPYFLIKSEKRDETSEKYIFSKNNTSVPKLTQDLNLPPFVQRSVPNPERKRISQLTV